MGSNEGGCALSFAYRVQSAKSVDDALASVQAALAAHRFKALWQTDMGATLAEKGFPGHGAMHVLEICNPARADELLQINAESAYFLPCRMLVRQTAEGSEIGILRPEQLIGLADEAEGAGQMAKLASDVEGELRAIVDDAAR